MLPPEGTKKVYSKYEPGFDSLPGPRVSVVTTAYSNMKFNEKYFETMNKQTYENLEVIFVDSRSPDDTVEDARKRLKNGKVVVSPKNGGCAFGNNVGVEEATGEYIFLVGPDTWVDEKCVEHMVKAAEKDDSQVYTSTQRTYDDTEFISCVTYHRR